MWISLVLLFLLSGCLPSSCRRTESRALTPADSLSRQIAGQITPDTLALAWTTHGSAAHSLAYPRTLLFGPEGRLYLSDAEAERLYTFDADGHVLNTAETGAAAPYLAGRRGDTLVVFHPEAHRLDFFFDGRTVRSVPTPADLPETALRYAAAGDSGVFFKAVGPDLDGYVARLDARGGIVQKTPLPGPHWRYAGLMRLRSDTLVSLSGFRPVLDVLLPGGARDTLALAGFDSPMLPRSRQFLRGEAHEAPLLTTSAAFAGPFLFVLNLRPGWLRIDAYDAAGRLRHILVQPEPAYHKEFYPLDLAARRRADGGYDLAVALVAPRPEVRVYRWQPPP